MNVGLESGGLNNFSQSKCITTTNADRVADGVGYVATVRAR